MSELDQLFTLIEDVKSELFQKVGELQANIVPGESLKESQKLLEKKVEHLKQLVEEYRQYKDPFMTEDNIRNLQGGFDRLNVQVAALNKKFKDFESKEWMRILSDEEIKAQYVNAGKPTCTEIAKHFKTTPQNAFNYTSATVKDDRIRWEFYRYCGGA